MNDSGDTFLLIKNKIGEVLPNAKVFLFGSRANDYANDESDWDILILTQDKPDNTIKKLIHDILFPISVNIAAFIDTVIVSETDWNNDPSYYSLHQSVSSEKIFSTDMV
ncbi:MAG TPA: nucleotidyltransferase domain-containing protein [Chitinophagaceae bacterium]|nr:nucleotidyltransferase domain-containing protein [Chitinophagaceae bacterium]